MSGPTVSVQPEHVSLAFLISALVAPPPPDHGWGQGFDGPTAQRHLALFLLEEIQDASSPTLTPLHTLLERLQQQLGQAGLVLARALVGILQSLTSPDDIVTVLQNFSTLLAQPGSTPAVATDAASIAYIATTSPLGMFLRRVRLGLSSMSIQRLAALADRIQRQLQQLAAQQYQAATNSSIAADSVALKDQSVIEAYVNQLLSLVETQGKSIPANMLEAAAARMSQLECEQPKLEYLRMAVSLAHKDMHAALSSLHKYFDSSGSALAGSSTATAGASGSSSTTVASLAAAAAAAAAAGSRPGKHKNHSALHSLSALHAHFGHPREALAALHELLRLGQQSGDEWGLLHALAGLCRVMAMSEGLQVADNSSSDGGGGGGGQTAAAAGLVGWGLLDFNRTEQQMSFQALLQRCLSTARDIRAPHIAAFAAVALCRFRLQHAAAADAGSSNHDDLGVTAAAAAASGAAQTAAAAGTSLMVQRMLLDVATLEHQAAVAAAAPAQPAVAAAAPTSAGASGAPSVAVRSTALYNPTEAFGNGTNSNIITTASAAANKAQPVGVGWRSSAAAVSQTLATAYLVAAAAMQLQGANSLAAVRLLMLLTGPGGDGAAAAADSNARQQPQQQQQSAEGGTSEDSSRCRLHRLKLHKGLGYVTGCGVRYEDIATGWSLVVELVAKSQGMAAAEHALSMAAAHFPVTLPEQLTAAQQQLRLQKCIHTGDLSTARLACQELQSLAPPQLQLEIESQLAAAEADALTQAAAGCWAEAHSAAASLFAVAAASGMQPQAVRALLLMGQACLNAGDHAGALPYALSALLHCQQLQLDFLLPEAVLLLAGAWQGLAAGSSGFVLSLLQQVLPAACACGDLKIKAELQEAVARVTLSLLQEDSNKVTADTAEQGAGSSKEAAANGPEGRSQGQAESQSTASAIGFSSSSHSRIISQGVCGFNVDLASVAQGVLSAAVMYEQAGCVDRACGCWLLLAHVCNAVGQVEARNEAAARWQLAQQQLMYLHDHE